MLRPRKRVKRHEIKEDALVTFYGRIQIFYRKYQKAISIALTSLLIIVVIFIFMSRSKKNAEFKAFGKLGIAEQYYFSMNYERAIQDLGSIVDAYSGTRAAAQAGFYLANSYFATGDLTNAEIYYRRSAKSNKQDDVIRISSTMGIAACLESQSRYMDAAKTYEMVSKKYPESFWAPFALKDAGRCYRLAGMPDLAKASYQTIIERYPDANIAQEVAFLEEAL